MMPAMIVYRLTPEATIISEIDQSSADPLRVGLVRRFCDGNEIGTIGNAATGAFLQAA
jgi:hypothetical protein